MPRPIAHFEIAARDAKTLQAFYGALFDWDINADNPMSYGLVSAKDGETGIDGAIYNHNADDPNDRPGIRLYMQVNDADAYTARAEELGGKSMGPAQEVPGYGIKVGGLTDPEGNTIGVIQALEV